MTSEARRPAFKKRLVKCLAEDKLDEVRKIFEEATQLAKDNETNLPKEVTGEFYVEVAKMYLDLHNTVGLDYKRKLEKTIQVVKELNSPK